MQYKRIQDKIFVRCDQGEEILEQLNIGNGGLESLKSFGGMVAGEKVGTPEILFARLDPVKKMEEIMDKMRHSYPTEIAGSKVIGLADYEESYKVDFATGAKTELTLPKSNVVTLYLENHESIIIRPSGTEPKIKLYYTTVGTSVEDAKAKQSAYSAEFTKLIK